MGFFEGGPSFKKKKSADWLLMLISHSLALEMSPGAFHVEMHLSALRTRKSVSESWDQESDIRVHVCNVGAFTRILILHVCLSDLAPLGGRKGLFGL